jgi:hypothetical protein
VNVAEADRVVERAHDALATDDPNAYPLGISLGSFISTAAEALTGAIERATDLGTIRVTESVFDHNDPSNPPFVIRHAYLTVSPGRVIDAQWSRLATAIDCSSLLEPSAKTIDQRFVAVELPTS